MNITWLLGDREPQFERGNLSLSRFLSILRVSYNLIARQRCKFAMLDGSRTKETCFNQPKEPMRALFIIAWLFIGLAAAIFHYGPGQKQLEMDRVDLMLDQARTHVSLNDYSKAIEQFDEILTELPSSQQELSQRIQLEKAKTQMHAAKLPEARDSLESLLTELREDEEPNQELIAETQSALANAQYFRTWLMRLEGMHEDAWKPEIESARQHYTQLNEIAVAAGDTEAAEKAAQDIESAVRLARMDLEQLQGLPLPSQ